MNELAKPQKCILMRSGIQIWVDEDRIVNLMAQMEKSKLIGVDGQYINTADISGVYNPETITELNKSKSGQWKCEHNNWILRGKRCQCRMKPEYREY